MNGVNLLPEPQRRSINWQGSRRPLAALAVVGLVGAVAFWGYSVRSEVDSVQEDVAVATAERDALQAQLGAYSAAMQAQGPEELRKGAVVALAAGRINWERIIRDVSAVAPRDVWLTNLKGETEVGDPAAAAPEPAAVGATPLGLHLEGYAFEHRRVAALMTRLDAVAGLGEPRLASSEEELLEEQRVVSFVIDVPIDKRVQDRPTLVPASVSAAATGAAVTP